MREVNDLRLLQSSILADGDCPADWDREDLLGYAQWAAPRVIKIAALPDATTLSGLGRDALLNIIIALREPQ